MDPVSPRPFGTAVTTSDQNDRRPGLYLKSRMRRCVAMCHRYFGAKLGKSACWIFTASHRCHDIKKREPQMSESIRSHLASKKKDSSMMNGQERTTGFVDGAIVRVKMRNFV